MALKSKHYLLFYFIFLVLGNHLLIHQDSKENAPGPLQFSTASGSLPARPEAHESGVFVVVPIRCTRCYFRRVGPFVISRCLVRLILCNCDN